MSHNKIAKNMLILYFRMFITMGVSLYTSRVVLDTLGVEDFGVYNVVAGVVALFSFLNASMSGATARFISFELGRKRGVEKVLSSAIYMHILLGVTVVFLGLAFENYFLEGILSIPSMRLDAARFVYKTTIISVFFVIIQVPFSALIIAHERFDVFAYIEITNALLKLAIVFLLSAISGDKLSNYGLMVVLATVVIFSINLLYTRLRLFRSPLHAKVDFATIRRMSSFSGWDLYGNLSVLARTQGVNILFNIFFGPLVNASNAIAMQVQSAVMVFANSALTAVKPQIVKSYACKDYNRVNSLIINTLKFTFFILLVITLPLVLEMKFILNLWLVEVPYKAVVFCQLILVFNLFSNASLVIITGIHATGKIIRPSLINGTLYLSVLPLSYIVFYFGGSSEISFLINICMVFIGMLSNAWTLHKYIREFSFSTFVTQVLVPSVFVAFLTSISLLSIIMSVPEGFWRLLIVVLTCFIIVSCLSYLFFLNKNERQVVFGFIAKKAKIFRFKHDS